MRSYVTRQEAENAMLRQLAQHTSERLNASLAAAEQHIRGIYRRKDGDPS